MTEAKQSAPLVIVTGAAGLLGRAVTEDLARDHTVVGLDIAPEPEGFAGAASYPCDLASDTSTEAALELVRTNHGGAVTSVVHLAAHWDFEGGDHELYQELNVNGTRRLLRGLATFDVEQVVYASSLLVMRPAALGERIDETSPVEASWPYPASVIEVEAALRESRGRVPVAILRIAACYDDTCHSVPLSQQIHRIHQRRLDSLFFPGNPQHGQQLVHADDVAQIVRKTIDRRLALDPVSVYLVAGHEHMTYAALQDHLGVLIHGTAWPTMRLPMPIAKAGVWLEEKLGDDARIKPWLVDIADANYAVSIDKAKADLAFAPRHRLRDALPRMIEALRADPERWYAEHGIRQPAAVGS